MRDLKGQDELEQLLGRQALPDDAKEPLPAFSILYFTAGWCGACKKLDLPAIEAAFPEATWLKCDVDAQSYSSGFCGVRSIPAFMIIRDQKPIGPITNSKTEKVLEWLQAQLNKPEKSKP